MIATIAATAGRILCITFVRSEWEGIYWIGERIAAFDNSVGRIESFDGHILFTWGV